MIKFDNIINELSSEFSDDFDTFTNQSPAQQQKIFAELQPIIKQWVGKPSNKKGMRIEQFMKNKRTDLYKYMQDALRREFGDTVELKRGIQYDANLFLYSSERNMNGTFYNMWRNKKGFADLMSKGIKYSSWTRDDALVDIYSDNIGRRSVAIGFKLYANIKVDDIIFCGETFPSNLYDEQSDMEYIVKHDKMIQARYELVRVGSEAEYILTKLKGQFKI